MPAMTLIPRGGRLLKNVTQDEISLGPEGTGFFFFFLVSLLPVFY